MLDANTSLLFPLPYLLCYLLRGNKNEMKSKKKNKITEDRLITLLQQVNEQTEKKTKVSIIRRRSALDDDDW